MWRKGVSLILYRNAGRFLFFRIRRRCKECDISYVILQNILAEQLQNKPVTLRILPWLSNWWRVLWRGGVQPPVLTLNGRIFSQGTVPDLQKLMRAIGTILNDEELISAVVPVSRQRAVADETDEVTVYFSPACPH
jgi:hypothetical protein